MRHWRGGLLLAGAAAALVAATLVPGRAASSAAQDYPAFVLVAGLLLIGLAAEGDGLFRAAGDGLARRAGSDTGLVLLGSGLVAVVSAGLNLDTAAAFLTPVLVRAGRLRPRAAPALLYASLLLANAGSLLLPGSNLTNLIVLGGRSPGGRFLLHMALPWVASVLVTTAVLVRWSRATPGGAAAGDRGLITAESSGGDAPGGADDRALRGWGLVGVISAVVLMVLLGSPALPVFAVGVAVTALRLATGRVKVMDALAVLDTPVLLGLLGVAVGAGSAARRWSGPARLLTHADQWSTAGLGALSSVVVNNLPAASLLSARPPVHPYALLVGLNLGPNLAATGSLAWVIWARAARRAGGHPHPFQASRLGLPAAVLSMAASVALLMAIGAA